MTPFTRLKSPAVPLVRDNIDTDIIIPSRDIRTTGRTGLADGLFAPWRYLDAAARVADPDFPINQPAYAGARILLAGANFGAGSSREHAVWALLEYGVRAVLAVSFSPIFRGNAIRNGLLPAVLDRASVEALAALAPAPVTIDLAAQSITAPGIALTFAIDADAKAMLLKGLDQIDLTLKHAAVTSAWTAADRTARPWVYAISAAAPDHG